MHLLGLGVVLFGFWLAWSGHYSVLITSLGAASCLFIVWLTRRMDILDKEAVPFHMVPRVFFYWIWLFKEIGKANWDLMKVIFSPKLNIQPNVFAAKATQKTDVGLVTYANSITLTPGTVTIDIDDDTFIVHALTDDFREGVLSGEMDARVSALRAESAEGQV